jgi:hypothetical protein
MRAIQITGRSNDVSDRPYVFYRVLRVYAYTQVFTSTLRREKGVSCGINLYPN